MIRSLVVLGLALASIAPPARASAQESVDYETGHKAAQVELVKRLEVLADWCNSKELFQERDRVWHSILALDASNAAARKGLRYARNPDGSWQEPAPREAKNRNAKALEELPAKRAAATEAFRETLLSLLAKEPETSPLRHTAYTEILAVDPDDRVVRGLRGEKDLDGKWVLEETWRAKKRRAEIKEFAKAAMASAAKIERLEPSANEKEFGVRWTSMLKSDGVRVLSTGDEAEARRTAELVQAAGPFFRAVFVCDTPHQESWTANILTRPGEQDLFLDRFPGMAPDFRAFLKNVVGCRFPGQPCIAYWDKEPARRLDGSARQTINDFLNRTFGLTMNHGWAWEGFGLYLTREITGTRFTWFIQPAPGGKYNAMRARLMSPDANWMNEALTLFGSNEHPKLAALLENDVNKMGIEDMLCAYALAAYLLEGRPEEAPEILREIGLIKQTTAQAIQNVLHMDASQVEERLHRWLTERK
jgi:hypothetical protein